MNTLNIFDAILESILFYAIKSWFVDPVPLFGRRYLIGTVDNNLKENENPQHLSTADHCRPHSHRAVMQSQYSNNLPFRRQHQRTQILISGQINPTWLKTIFAMS